MTDKIKWYIQSLNCFSFPCRLLPCHLTSLLLCLAFKVAMKTRLALARHGAVGAARYSEDTATVSDEDLGTLQSDQSCHFYFCALY
jgi:hypothetical protein